MKTGRPPQEYQEQIALFDWARLHAGVEPALRLLHHIPNGEKREKATAARLQRMGVKPGVPDICLPYPMPAMVTALGERPAFHGCYIELKRRHAGVLTPHQHTWKDRLQRLGFAYDASEGWLNAARYLCWYLNRHDLVRTLGETP